MKKKHLIATAITAITATILWLPISSCSSADKDLSLEEKSQLVELIELLKDREQLSHIGFNEQVQALINAMESSGMTDAITAIKTNAPIIPEILLKIQKIDEGRTENAARLTISEALLEIHKQRINNLEDERKVQRVFNERITDTISELGEGFRVLGNSFKLKVEEYDKYENVFWAFVGSIPAQVLAIFSILKWIGNRKRDKTLDRIANQHKN